MFIVNQVINFEASPGILASALDISANDCVLGTIRFDTQNVLIRRAEGTPGSQNWVTYASGSGGGNLQEVLDNGNEALNQSIKLTNDDSGEVMDLFSNDFYLYKDNNKEFYLTANYQRLAIVTDNSVITFGENYISALDSINAYTITARFSADIQIFQIEHNGNANGLKLDWTNNVFALGDFSGLNSSTYIRIDDDSGKKDIILNYDGKIRLNGTNVTSATSGGNASAHLIVYINNTEYKIQLKNP
jgi:hypothetical protein